MWVFVIHLFKWRGVRFHSVRTYTRIHNASNEVPDSRVSLHFFSKTICHGSYWRRVVLNAKLMWLLLSRMCSHSEFLCSRSLAASLLAQRIINTRVSKWKCTAQCASLFANGGVNDMCLLTRFTLSNNKRCEASEKLTSYKFEIPNTGFRSVCGGLNRLCTPTNSHAFKSVQNKVI